MRTASDETTEGLLSDVLNYSNSVNGQAANSRWRSVLDPSDDVVASTERISKTAPSRL